MGIGVAALGNAVTAPVRAAELPKFDGGGLQFVGLRPVEVLPDLVLFRLKGGALRLASMKEKPILLNFWASWCALCRTELPMLDALQKSRASALTVLAVSTDHDGSDKVERFVNSLHLSALALFRDPSGYIAHASADNPHAAPFALYGMPITYCVGSSGTVVGYVNGAADWVSPDGDRLIKFLKAT